MTRLLTIIFSLHKPSLALDVFTISKTQRQINQDLTGMYKEKASTSTPTDWI